jgi:hypothetical protein
MPVGKKKSPAKFIGAVSLGLGVIKGATSIIGGIQERKRLRKENQRAKKQYQGFRDDINDLKITNPYADLPTTFENTFEDLTVNQQQAQFQAQQSAQARANLLSNLQGAAGASGIAGLAQALANQQQLQGQQISASIGQQEAVNQRLRAQGAAGVQAMEQQARQTVLRGEGLRQENENQRQIDLMNLKAGRQQAQREFRTSMQGAKQQMLGGVGNILGAGLQGFASGGGFSKDGFSMDTFLGRDDGFGDVTEILDDGSVSITGAGGPVGDVEKAESVFSGGFQPVSPSSSNDIIPQLRGSDYYTSDEYLNSLEEINVGG